MRLLEDGSRIGETLVVDRLLGAGAFAEVYRVRHSYLGSQALKIFKRVASATETHGMLEEARLLSTLGHRNLVRVFDAGVVDTDDGVRGYFTMEYVAGGGIDRLVAAHEGVVPLHVATEVIAQLAEGLAVAHMQDPPVLHRDLTPANVLVGYDGHGIRVRVSDFGLAKRADPFTLAASAQGTYAFMAPEVLLGGTCTRAADVWSIGSLGYLLLTNHLPWTDGRPFASFSAARFRRPLLAPSRYNDDVDPDLDALVLATLAVEPGDRPQHAGELLHAMSGLRARATSPSSTPSPAPGRDAGRARDLLVRARELARSRNALADAADLLEEAMSLDPALRATELERLTRWRRGVAL